MSISHLNLVVNTKRHGIHLERIDLKVYFLKEERRELVNKLLKEG